jgi:hypothetical protein
VAGDFFPLRHKKTLTLPDLPLSFRCRRITAVDAERESETMPDPKTIFDNLQREIPYGSEMSLAATFGESLGLCGGHSLRREGPVFKLRAG